VAEAATPGDGDEGALLGKLALEEGLLTPDQLRTALVELGRDAARGASTRLDAILLKNGYLTPAQVEALLEKGAARPSPPPAPDSRPSQIGKFRIRGELGRGGMGVVYEAYDQELDRLVAVKMIVSSPNATPKEAALDEERFLREARLSAKLKHPHIVTVYEAGSIDGRRFIAMEYVPGPSLSAWRRAGSVTIRQQVSLLRDVALAVHHAHQQGIIHRDLKPENILIDTRNEPHVTDFGLAKVVGQNATLSYTGEGRVVGTPAYMSPEQVEGRETLDRRVDVYSLGVLLYETLAGRLPFEGRTPVEVMMKVLRDPVRPPSKITAYQMNPFLYQALESICLKAMARNPRDRYPTAAAMADDLGRWLKGEPVRVSRPLARRLPPGVRAAAVAGLLVALGGLAGWLIAKPGKPGAAGAAAPAPLAEGAWKGSVDLLPLVVPSRDAVEGTWTAVDGRLLSDATRAARVEIPYEPPEEYDVRVVFTRMSGQRDVNLILTRSGRPFTWLMGAFDNTIFGFELVRGALSNANPSTRYSKACLENGREHSAVVQVRKTGLKAYLDGRLVAEYGADGSDLDILPARALRSPRALGLGSYMSPTAFHRVEVLEVAGRGRILSPR
jgi:predicted Ser/Thr protein kinase